MKGVNNILLEGRVEDAQKYFEDAVGSWPVAEPGNPAGVGGYTNLEGVLDHFVKEDPSGNHKYLMWMIKTYLNESSTAPFEITDLIKRFHKNVDRLNAELIDELNWEHGLYSKSPKDINSYDGVTSLERLMDEVEGRQTRKEKEIEAKKGGEKIYEDNRWLVVKPHTLEASCYYGAGTKWCTTTKDTSHFQDYSKKGPLYYIIDKSRELGRFYKIAMHATWEGREEYYDERDKLLTDDVLEAIKLLLPKELQDSIFDDWQDASPPPPELMSLTDFVSSLEDYVERSRKQQTIKTQSGVWDLNIDDGVWAWTNRGDSYVEVQATPFFDGQMMIPFDSDDIPFENEDSSDPWGRTYRGEYLQTPYLTPEKYLDPNPQGWHSHEGMLKGFLNHIYRPLVSKVLDGAEVQEAVGNKYTTWQPSSYVSSYAFKYPPKKGSMTQLFTDYLKENPGKTSNQFYQDVLGYSRPRGHNNMFFASLKDSGIVKMERQGRQFVYSLGPNYKAWIEGKLLRSGTQYR